MNERERLIELIVNADTYDSYECKLCDKDDDACDSCYAEKLAEHLLANGLIVLPCKVGDTVYKITPNGLFIKDYEVVGFHLGDFLTLRGHKRKPYLVSYDRASRYLKHITFADFGETVFLTREEAEAALKERREK